jgi:hypothetical protein
MTTEEKKTLLDALPEQFGLRGFPGRTFKVDKWSCFYSPHSDDLQVVVDVWDADTGDWLYFAREGYEAFLKQMC